MSRVGWTSTKIRAVETTGAASFAAAKAAGHIVSLAKISTIATTLGALAVTPAVLESEIITESAVVSDEEAVTASYYFANDYRILVEPACGASLSLVLLQRLREKYYTGPRAKKLRIVVIVCGGSAVSLELMNEWKERYVLPYESSATS
jgi:L-serine/L-threonine ammonia-lyase